MQNFDLENVDCHATLAMTENTQSGRSLLPESGADAPAVLSAVYTDSTQAKNRQADVPQYGRSMIEMLGVLAIIGVLSVGGIAGYSKAMMKYRINKTIEQITLIAGNIRTFFGPQRNYIGSYCWCSDADTYCSSGNTPDVSAPNQDGCPVIKKAKIVPDEMITLDSTGKLITSITNAFGDIILWGGNKDGFEFGFSGIPAEACIELASYNWEEAGATFITVIDEVGNGGDWTAKVPVSVDTAVKLCSTGSANTYEMIFEFDDKTCSGCVRIDE